MRFRHHLPDWMYEILPWLYMLAGLLTMLELRNGLGVLSGLILVCAGFSVWLMRKRNRSPAANGVSREAKNGGSAGLFKLVWCSAYECGDALIDEQHIGLFDLGNELINGLLESKPHAEELLDDFIKHIVIHFDTEDSLVAQADDPLAQAHHLIHQKLLQRANQLKRRFHHAHGDGVVRDLVSFIAYDVVAQHLVLEDPKIAHVALGRAETTAH